jgi:hypothetical protein
LSNSNFENKKNKSKNYMNFSGEIISPNDSVECEEKINKESELSKIEIKLLKHLNIKKKEKSNNSLNISQKYNYIKESFGEYISMYPQHQSFLYLIYEGYEGIIKSLHNKNEKQNEKLVNYFELIESKNYYK